MNQSAPKVDTLLQGFGVNSDQGGFAFCGINLIEGVDADGALKRIVVDTGHTGRRRLLDAELAKRGLSGSDIDMVILTHAHWDHVQNVNAFDRAEILLHRNERRYIAAPHRNDNACPDWTKGIFDTYQERVREVEEGTQIIPGVEIVDAPGHSAGTIAVTAATAEGLAVITGDAIQNSAVAVNRRNALVFWNNELATQSVEKLVSIADVIYPGHDQAFRIDGNNNVEYVQKFQFTLTGVTPDDPGLSFEYGSPFEQRIMQGIEEQGFRAG